MPSLVEKHKARGFLTLLRCVRSAEQAPWFGAFGNGSLICESNEMWTEEKQPQAGLWVALLSTPRGFSGRTGEKQGWKMGQRWGDIPPGSQPYLSMLP